MLRFIFAFIFALCGTVSAMAQTTGAGSGNSITDNGKIYVVLAVCLVILAGLIGYLFMLDRRITRMEQQKDEA